MRISLEMSAACLIAVLLTAGPTCGARAAEYEVRGRVKETIVPPKGPNLDYSGEFTVLVRGCDWQIRTVERDAEGNVTEISVGTTNGTDLYETEAHSSSRTNTDAMDTSNQKRPPPHILAIITPGGLPQGTTDRYLIGHLWLMFASGCYWTSL